MKKIEYQILREWTLEQPSRRATTWTLITTALRVFLVFTTWGDRPEIRFGSPKNITHVIFSRCIFSKILLKNVQTHLLDLIYYIRYFHTFLVKSHGHRGGQGVLVKGKGTWAPGPSPGAPWAGPRPGPRAPCALALD